MYVDVRTSEFWGMMHHPKQWYDKNIEKCIKNASNKMLDIFRQGIKIC